MSARPTVLVVDPDRRTRQAIIALLHEMGYEPRVAGTEALSRREEAFPAADLLVCDWAAWLDVQEGPVGEGSVPAFPPLVLVAHSPEQRERDLAVWVGAFDLVEPPLTDLTRAALRRVLAQAWAASRDLRAELLRRGA